jgi:hypothetical protein
MESDKLRKLAAMLRTISKENEAKKTKKLANLVLATTGLELLRQKIEE